MGMTNEAEAGAVSRPHEGAVVVVTGAGRGIGAAMARAFAAEGAHVVVNDLDADAAETVAREISGLAVPGDAASDAGVATLMSEARGWFGEIDVFCANAGVGTAGGPEAAEDLWAQSWDVNVMAHVRAARALLPGWLERGRGRFVSTVSAEGLLTMLGTAPYSVTTLCARKGCVPACSTTRAPPGTCCWRRPRSSRSRWRRRSLRRCARTGS